MGEKLLTKRALLGLLRGELRTATARSVAEKIGVSEGFLSDVLRGSKPLGRRIPKHYGYTPVLLYEWKISKRRAQSPEQKAGRAET